MAMQLCPPPPRHYPKPVTSSARRPSTVLPRLRRSLRLAVLALAVFVLRVGLVTACAPGDLAESLAGESAVSGLHADNGGSPDAPDHSGGHCLHCSCHHAAAVPAVVLLTAPVVTATLVEIPSAAQANAPPDLSLRPPIA
jgi:hypothetical protein